MLSSGNKEFIIIIVAPALANDLGVHVSVRSSVRQHLPWVSCESNTSYSFVPIFFKLCRCFLHGMRMCIIIGHFFHFVIFVIFRPQCIDSGYLVSATPHTILYRSFETLHMFSPWSEDVHVVWM